MHNPTVTQQNTNSDAYWKFIWIWLLCLIGTEGFLPFSLFWSSMILQFSLHNGYETDFGSGSFLYFHTIDNLCIYQIYLGVDYSSSKSNYLILNLILEIRFATHFCDVASSTCPGKLIRCLMKSSGTGHYVAKVSSKFNFQY